MNDRNGRITGQTIRSLKTEKIEASSTAQGSGDVSSTYCGLNPIFKIVFRVQIKLLRVSHNHNILRFG